MLDSGALTIILVVDRQPHISVHFLLAVDHMNMIQWLSGLPFLCATISVANLSKHRHNFSRVLQRVHIPHFPKWGYLTPTNNCYKSDI